MKNISNVLLTALAFVVIVTACTNDDAVKACFSYTTLTSDAGLEVQFENCSENATSFSWEFRNLDTVFNSTDPNPRISIDNFMLATIVTLTAINSSDSDVLTDTIYDWAIAYKPNIYLYPLKPDTLCVSLFFPMGGYVTASIPEYQNQWCVSVLPNGLINNTYGYLFYESMQPNIWQQNEGFCIARSDLKTWFENILTTLNFNPTEVADFTEYWVPKLSDYPYYLIYPQNHQMINRVIQVQFSKQPDSFYRLFMGFKGVTSPVNLPVPELKPATREGFTAIEWGGLFL